MVSDAHCHFFSAGFFRSIGKEACAEKSAVEALPERLGWDPPGRDDELADRWATEFDANDVSRAMLIASVPCDEASVAVAVERHPARIVGAFMLNAGQADAVVRAERAFKDFGLSTVCLFPAMHRVAIDDPRTEQIFACAERYRRAVFVHCGMLSVGIRKRLGLPSPFDLRLGDPLAVAAMAVRHPSVPVIIPHFGAGLFREALMAALAAPNILLDTSSSNAWMRSQGLTLRDVFARAIDTLGPSRLLFGTDSSFFPRGWHRAVYDEQREVLESLNLAADDLAGILEGNFGRIFRAPVLAS